MTEEQTLEINWIKLYERLTYLEVSEQTHTKAIEKLLAKVDILVDSIQSEREARLYVEKTYLKVIAGVFLLASFNQLWTHIGSKIVGQ